MNVRAQAQAQLRQLIQSEALGGALSTRFAISLNKKALALVSKSGKFKITAAEIANMTNDIAELMVTSYVRRYAQARKAIGIELAFTDDVRRFASQFDLNLANIKKNFVDISGRQVNKAAKVVEKKVNGALSRVTSKQQPTKVLIKAMRRELDAMGLTAAKPAIVETLVRTHSQIAFNAAQYQLEQDDPEDLITGYQYVTVGDSRVRDEHEELEGVIFDKDDPRLEEFWPPNGWNCRCQLVALTDPVESTRIPRGVRPDEGFDFNPGELLD